MECLDQGGTVGGVDVAYSEWFHESKSEEIQWYYL